MLLNSQENTPPLFFQILIVLALVVAAIVTIVISRFEEK